MTKQFCYIPYKLQLVRKIKLRLKCTLNKRPQKKSHFIKLRLDYLAGMYT